MTDSLPASPKYPISITLPVYWGEMDAFRHVNNIYYLRWIEAARIEYMLATGSSDFFDPKKYGPILARTEIDYLMPLVFPDNITVSVSVTRIGNTSFDMDFLVTSEAQAGKIAAKAKNVIVLVDYSQGKKITIPDELRNKILATES